MTSFKNWYIYFNQYFTYFIYFTGSITIIEVLSNKNTDGKIQIGLISLMIFWFKSQRTQTDGREDRHSHVQEAYYSTKWIIFQQDFWTKSDKLKCFNVLTMLFKHVLKCLHLQWPYEENSLAMHNQQNYSVMNLNWC